MPISDVASLVGGAALGAPFSEILKLVIAEAKKVKDFKPLSQDLASTMERLVPVLKEIDLMQEGLDPGKGELKVLIKTMQSAEEIVRKCSRIQWYSITKKALYTREIKGINQDFLRFCQIELQLIQHKNQLHSMRSMASVTTKIDLLSDRGKEFMELCLEPQPEEATIFWLDRPLRELKKILFEDGVVTIVVSAPSACGKTTLVTKLCHDADVKGKFKQIFFISLSKTPNVKLIIQRLLWHSSGIVNEIENDLDARLCIKQLLKQLQQCGPILLVLDDVRPEEESLLEKFLIQFPHCKLLVTSRFEFPRLGPTYHLEPLIDEDVKNLFIDCVPQPNCISCAKRDDLLQKMLKRCNGLPLALNPPCSMCDGCNSAIKDGRSVNVLGGVWHPECFCCLACHKPIAIHEFSNSKGKFHKSCYKKHRLPNCYVCKEKIPSNAQGIEYNEHPFWLEKYCPSHDTDGTAKCCSCERLKPIETKYVMLGDGRWLCLECLESTIMDTDECQVLHIEIREFFEGLNMKIENEFPLLLVEKEALNRTKEYETIDNHHEVVIRGSCLSEERIISIVSRAPKMGPNGIFIDMGTESQMLVRQCEVTAVLVMYGLPRLLTGSILAHEMMHAWLRLNGYNDLKTELEDGLCQVIAHMWLESQTCNADASSHKPTKATNQPWESNFEKKLVELFKMQIEDDYSPHGDGFRKVNEMVSNSSIQETLKSVRNSKSVIDDAYRINTCTRRTFTRKVREGITKFPFRRLGCFFPL